MPAIQHYYQEVYRRRFVAAGQCPSRSEIFLAGTLSEGYFASSLIDDHGKDHKLCNTSGCSATLKMTEESLEEFEAPSENAASHPVENLTNPAGKLGRGENGEAPNKTSMFPAMEATEIIPIPKHNVNCPCQSCCEFVGNEEALQTAVQDVLQHGSYPVLHIEQEAETNNLALYVHDVRSCDFPFIAFSHVWYA